MHQLLGNKKKCLKVRKFKRYFNFEAERPNLCQSVRVKGYFSLIKRQKFNMNFNIEDQPYKCSNRLAVNSILFLPKIRIDAGIHLCQFQKNKPEINHY